VASYDLDALLRRINRSPAMGEGQSGLNYTGSMGSSSGLNPNYTPQPNSISPIPDNAMPDYKSLDDMAFDRTYQTNYDALQRRLADASSQYDLANQQDEEEYQRAIRETGQQQELDAAGLTDRMANQGILRSGIQVKAQGDLAKSYQNRLGEFDRQRNSSKTQREGAYTGIKRDVQDQLAGLQNERTSREAARQEAIARRMAESQAQSQQELQRSQPQTNLWGTITGGMGFGGTPRTVVGGRNSNMGIPEGPIASPSPIGLGKGMQPPAPAPYVPGVIPGFETLPPEVQNYLKALSQQGR
jgi:hypothetical protein